MEPYGSQDFKTLLLLQIAAESFHTFPEFSSYGPHKTTFGIFEIFTPIGSHVKEKEKTSLKFHFSKFQKSQT